MQTERTINIGNGIIRVDDKKISVKNIKKQIIEEETNKRIITSIQTSIEIDFDDKNFISNYEPFDIYLDNGKVLERCRFEQSGMNILEDIYFISHKDSNI